MKIRCLVIWGVVQITGLVHAMDRPLETAFEMPNIQGNPFDPVDNDVNVTFRAPDGLEILIPAFYDGASNWKARLWPSRQGKYVVERVMRNGKPIDSTPVPRSFVVESSPAHGFVRVDPTGKRFEFEDGWVYYPIGVNLAWRNGREPPLTESLGRIARLGGNWSRIWMTHFDGEGGMNLDWVPRNQPKIGELSLDVARRWDTVIEAAGSEGVALQVVLQHHGQYSSQTDSNWAGNPWNKANGGWLNAPGDFFSDREAIRLTKAKYRYLVARWGYAPQILAWELFNEVEWTDPMRAKQPESVVAWHAEMAEFLRKNDPNRHLVTTSSASAPQTLWTSMDYEQRHAYPVDIVPAIDSIASESQKASKPLFVGEFGPQNIRSKRLREPCLHLGLWSSLMSPMPGAGQFWFWDDLGDESIVRHLRSATLFLRESGLADHRDLKPIKVVVKTSDRTPLTFSPGSEWRASSQRDFSILSDGEISGLDAMPRFLQGMSHREMFPSAAFQGDFPENCTFSVTVDTVARAGATLELRLDDKIVETKNFAAASGDVRLDATVSIRVPIGRHTISMSNPGADWLRIGRIRVDPFLNALAATAKGSDSFFVAWIRRTGDSTTANQAVKGEVAIPGLKPGRYRVCWRDTISGLPLVADEVVSNAGILLRLQTPAVISDAVVFMTSP